MGNKLRHEGDEVRIKVIWPDTYTLHIISTLLHIHHCIITSSSIMVPWLEAGVGSSHGVSAATGRSPSMP